MSQYSGFRLVGVQTGGIAVCEVWVIDCKGCGQDCTGRYGDTPIGEGLDGGWLLYVTPFFEKTLVVFCHALFISLLLLFSPITLLKLLRAEGASMLCRQMCSYVPCVMGGTR